MDLRTWNQNVYEKAYVQLLPDQIQAAAKIYHDWQSVNHGQPVGSRVPRDRYAQPELYYSATKAEVAEKGYSLVPSRYIAFVDRDTEMEYKAALKEISAATLKLVEAQLENGQTLVKAMNKLAKEARA